jgi:hypothetical protein
MTFPSLFSFLSFEVIFERHVNEGKGDSIALINVLKCLRRGRIVAKEAATIPELSSIVETKPILTTHSERVSRCAK